MDVGLREFSKSCQKFKCKFIIHHRKKNPHSDQEKKNILQFHYITRVHFLTMTILLHYASFFFKLIFIRFISVCRSFSHSLLHHAHRLWHSAALLCGSASASSVQLATQRVQSPSSNKTFRFCGTGTDSRSLVHHADDQVNKHDYRFCLPVKEAVQKDSVCVKKLP